MWLSRLLVGTIMLLGMLAAPASAQAERRVALVIGNERYRHLNELSNPAHDAAVIGASLQAAGFELIGGKPLVDADKKTIEAAIRNFGQKLQGGAVALFYYSGHGVQVGDRNYLVPVEAAPNSVADVDFELVGVDLVMKQLANGGGRLSMVILDACRTNPLAGRDARAAGGGLAAMEAPQGTIISYATAPGKTAADGPAGTNSPFAAALAKAMREPGLGVLDMFNDVGVAVDEATGGRQQPWLAVSPLRGRFSFATAAAPASMPVAVADTRPAPARPPAPAALGPGAAASVTASVVAALHPAAPAAGGDVLQRAATAEDAKDYDLAFKLYREAADQGSARGQFNVGYFYRNGLSVDEDAAEAARWYRRAADQGYATAQNNLGLLYSQGEGVKQDYGMARRLYTSAAEQGNATAQSNLGLLYLKGRGVTKDQATARAWFKKAAVQGNKTAIATLAELDSG